MSDRKAFLQAIREAPDDDGPRLRFADWLEETGGEAERARAEFVRLQCALARLPASDPGWPVAREKVEDLCRRYGQVWFAPVFRGSPDPRRPRPGTAADWIGRVLNPNLGK